MKQRHGCLVTVKAGVYRSIMLAPLVSDGPTEIPPVDHTLHEDSPGIWLGKVRDAPDLHIVAIGVGVNETVDIQVPHEAYTISS